MILHELDSILSQAKNVQGFVLKPLNMIPHELEAKKLSSDWDLDNDM